MADPSVDQQAQEILAEAMRIAREQGPDAARRHIADIAAQMFAVAMPKPVEPTSAPPPRPAPPPAVQPSSVEAGRPFVELVKTYLPAINTQAEYDAVVGAFGALRNNIAAILSGDKERSTQADALMGAALSAVRMAKEGSDKLREVPEAATSEASEAFKVAPKQFVEDDVLQRLLDGLTAITEHDAFTVWYRETRVEREGVVTPALRNKLYDAIRAKKLALS